MRLELNPRFTDNLQMMFDRYDMQVGILKDSVHKEPKEHPRGTQPEQGKYAGGPVRKKGRKNSDLSTAEIFNENQENLHTNLLTEPFQRKSSDIIKFTDSFMKMVFAKSTMNKRVENLLQAIVRNPILRLDYGNNGPDTADMKGFDRKLFDTGQMFKAIRARVNAEYSKSKKTGGKFV